MSKKASNRSSSRRNDSSRMADEHFADMGVSSRRCGNGRKYKHNQKDKDKQKDTLRVKCT